MSPLLGIPNYHLSNMLNINMAGPLMISLHASVACSAKQAIGADILSNNGLDVRS
jgi:hypothetical protein